MNSLITAQLSNFSDQNISSERKEILQGLVNYIQSKKEAAAPIRLNFICTHNSRRSHLSQIWAQTMANYFGVNNVQCYSGGTEATALFPKVAETLVNQGFEVLKLSAENNPVYAFRFDPNEAPILCFSKAYNHSFNPKSAFGAILTCNSADEACPVVLGAEARFPIKYDDPKAFDGTDLQDQKYAERSLEIAQELWWVFREVK